MGPKTLLVAAAIVATVGFGTSPAAAQVAVGIDIGRATEMSPELFQQTVVRLEAAGIRSVRVAFDLTNAPDESARLLAYKNVVTALRERGIEVLAVLDRSIVTSGRDPFTNRVLSSDAETKGEAERWIKAYAAQAGKIALAFKDEIRDFEVLNEPNRRLSAGPWVSPERFAQVLGAASKEIKAARADAVVISGPLLFDDSLPGTVDAQIKSVTGYMKSTIRAGDRGDLWESFERPFDSIGLHPFILQVKGQRAKDESGAVRAYAADTLGRLVRGLVKASGVAGMDVTVSGVGIALQPKNRTQPDPRDLDEERLRQAFLLDKVIGTLGERGLPVRGVHAFFVYDYGTAENVQRFGLLERDGGRDRPAFHVLRYHAARFATKDMAPPVFEEGISAVEAPHKLVAPTQATPAAVGEILDAAARTKGPFEVIEEGAPALKGIQGTVTERPRG